MQNTKNKTLFQFIITKFTFFILHYDGRNQCIYQNELWLAWMHGLIWAISQFTYRAFEYTWIIEREQHYVIYDPNSSQANGKNKNQILNACKFPSAHKTPSPSMHNTRGEEVDELAKTIRQITNTTNVYAFDVSLLDYRTQSYWQLQ